MTPEEYKEKSNDFAAQYNNAMRRLNQEYALSNSPYQAGDTITDGSVTLIIKKILAYYGGLLPSCLYYGIELEKDGKPKKKQDGTCIFQSCVKGKV